MMEEQRSKVITERGGFEDAVLLALSMESHKLRNVDDF